MTAIVFSEIDQVKTTRVGWSSAKLQCQTAAQVMSFGVQMGLVAWPRLSCWIGLLTIHGNFQTSIIGWPMVSLVCRRRATYFSCLCCHFGKQTQGWAWQRPPHLTCLLEKYLLNAHHFDCNFLRSLSPSSGVSTLENIAEASDAAIDLTGRIQKPWGLWVVMAGADLGARKLHMSRRWSPEHCICMSPSFINNVVCWPIRLVHKKTNWREEVDE